MGTSRKIKSIISVVLTVAMVMTTCPMAFATQNDESVSLESTGISNESRSPQAISELVDAGTVIREGDGSVTLESSRISGEELPAGNLVYFGTAAANLPETEQKYNAHIYREGDLSQEATVDVCTLDLTAVYGEDYELVMDDVDVVGTGKSILEKYSEADSGDATENVVGDEGENADNADTKLFEYTADSADEPETSMEEEPSSGRSELAALREKETGEPSRDLSNTELQSMGKAIMDELVPEQMNNLDYSARTTVTFAPGEDDKIISFRILDDFESEGSEGFSILLNNVRGAEIYKVTALAITIQDDEPVEHSKVSFTKASYRSEDGNAVLTVKRTGAVYSIVDMNIRTNGGVSGKEIDYKGINETLSFKPYETEKTIEIPVSGKGKFDVTLSGFKACKEGRYTKATVTVDEEESIALMSDSSDGLSMSVVIGGKTYSVDYSMGRSVGKIMDNSYSPALQVGEYHFSSDKEHGGNFLYGKNQMTGDEPWGCGVLESNYELKYTDTMEGNYGNLKYYHTSMWEKGSVFSKTNERIPLNFYQYLSPDWESTENTFGGQLAKFELYTPDKDIYVGKTGKFSRTAGETVVETGKAGSVQSNDDGSLYVYAADEDGGKTPKSYVRFYGIAAMFKKYEVSVKESNTLDYKNGSSTQLLKVEPAQVSVKCGAQVLYKNESRDIYANPDEKIANMVFSIGNTRVNGHEGKFGSIIGYGIVINPATTDEKTELTYPEDYLEYLEKHRGTTNGNLSFSSDIVDKQIDKILKNLDTIPFDKYFIQWIEDSQEAVVDDGKGYMQKLEFTPVFDYNDVTVSVLPASGSGGGAFNDPELQAGAEIEYHAGDLLDLSATASDTENHHIVGYEVSVDGGERFDTITSEKTLFLESFKSYMIRPVVAENDNRIEIEFADDEARDNIEIVNLIPQEELEADPSLAGKNIINLNPNAATAAEKMKPTVGKDYTIAFKVKGTPAEAGYVYRPVITEKFTGHTFNTQVYYTVAKAQMSDNLLTVSVETVEESKLAKYTVKGNLMSSYPPIRSDGLTEKELPAANYSVSVGNGQDAEKTIQFLTATTGSDGAYTFIDLYAKDGDTIPILVSNGLSNGQVLYTSLKGTAEEENGNVIVQAQTVNLSYPTDAPRVTDIIYSYNKSANNQSADNTQNSVTIFDDTINITASVDLKGRVIEKAVFTVYTVTGVRTSYEVPRTDQYNQFTCSIPHMTENLYNGDRISVHLVDAEENILTVGEGIATVNIEYPEVDTGLVFYTSNTISAPQTYETDGDYTIDVPLINASTAYSQSGLLSWNKTDWGDGTGYTLDINLNAGWSNMGSLSTIDKKNAFNGYIQIANAEKAAWGGTEKKLNAEETNLSSLNIVDPNNAEETKKLNKADDEVSLNEQALKETGNKNAKQSVAGLNKAAILSVSATLLIVLQFVHDPVTDEYVFCNGAVTLGGTFNFNKTIYTMITYVPCFVNITGRLQADLVTSFVGDQMYDAFSEGDFEGYSGNIASFLGGLDINSVLKVMFDLKGQVGVGMCGVVSARGYATIKLQFDIANLGQTVEENEGVLLGSEGGVGFDLLVTSVDVNLYSAMVGWGSLEGRTEVSFFGGLVPVYSETRNPQIASILSGYDGEKILSVGENGEVISARSVRAGTSNLSSFGRSKLVNSTAEAVSKTVLLPSAAERTRPQILQLEDGKKMIIFIANRGDSQNELALYYSVFDGSEWSEPEIVADDGTVDSTPTMIAQGDNVIIAWADAGRKFTAEDTAITKLQTFGISSAVYNIDSGIMSDEYSLVQDGFFNLSPQLNVSGDKVYCSYMKRDIGKAKDERDLLDFAGIYSSMNCVEYDMKTGTQGKETFIQFKHPTLKDPLVFDYRAAVTEVGKDSYLLSTYTVDEDKDLKTDADRTLWMEIENLTTGKAYYPVQITDGSKGATEPKLTECRDDIYLSYLSEGYLFNMVNASAMIKSMFAPETVTDANTKAPLFDVAKVAAAYKDADSNDEDWYKKTAAELSMDEAVYDGSIYMNIANGDFRQDSVNFKQTDDAMTNISDYIVAGNDDQIYVFFTDSAMDENGTIGSGQEIYGARYRNGSSVGNVNSQPGSAGFTKAVRVTDFDAVIDELDLFVTNDDKISAVSNYFKQWIDENGKIQYSDNSLVEIEFAPKDSMEINGDLDISSRLVGGEKTEIKFDIENNGLFPSTGYRLRVTQSVNGVETEIYSETSTDTIDTKESKEITVPWTVPENLSNTYINVYLAEAQAVATTPAISQKVNYDSRIELENVEIVENKNNPFIKATIKNTGNKVSPKMTGSVGKLNSKSAIDKVYSKFSIPALASGAVEEIEIPITIAASDFARGGIINLKLAAVSGGVEKAAEYVTISSSKPLFAEINGNSERIVMRTGNTATLSAVAAPWNEIAKNVKYYSEDNSVASVDSEGKVTANKEGVTTLYAYYPFMGVGDSINVSVTDGGHSGDSEETPQPDTETKTDVVIPATENGNSATVEIKASDVEKAKELTITSDVADVSFDEKAVEAIAGQSENLILEISLAEKTDLTEEQQQQVEKAGASAVIDINLTKGNETVSGFNGGKVTVSVPYTLKPGEKPAGMVVYYLADDGTLEQIDARYDEAKKCIVFSTGHFSKYIIAYDEKAPAEAAAKAFTDVNATDWFADSVGTLYKKGIIKGKTETTFEPQSNVTRAEYIAILARMSGQTMPEASADFDDVSEDSWYSMYVTWGVKAGIVNGTGDGQFSPDANITRQDMAVMITRYADYMNQELSGEGDAAEFADGAAIADYAKESVEALQKAGIINGIKAEDGSFLFAPENNATRAEAATVLCKMSDNI